MLIENIYSLDFTINKYNLLIDSLIERKFNFTTFLDFLENNADNSINKTFFKSNATILRHDVDLLPENSLIFAKIQNKKGIKATYYFRVIPQSYNEIIIKEISDLGHEIGYHYENMDTCNGNIDLAWDDFRRNLDKLRDIVDIKTICMHGSPLSKFDNKDLWLNYDYSSLDIVGEPYFDIDFNKIFYLTDTGRKWDGWLSSVRDKVNNQKEWVDRGMIYNSTDDIIKSIMKNTFPTNSMFTFHPQRWHKNLIPWTKELILQNIKNVIKRSFFVNK